MRSKDLRLAFFRMQALGDNMPKISASLGVHKRTLQRWQKSGPEPPLRRNERPNVRKLTREACLALQHYFESNNTTTLQQAAQWLKQRFDICIIQRSVANYCKCAPLLTSQTFLSKSHTRAPATQARASLWAATRPYQMLRRVLPVS